MQTQPSDQTGAQCDGSAPYQSLFYSPKKRNLKIGKKQNKKQRYSFCCIVSLNWSKELQKTKDIKFSNLQVVRAQQQKTKKMQMSVVAQYYALSRCLLHSVSLYLGLFFCASHYLYLHLVSSILLLF